MVRAPLLGVSCRAFAVRAGPDAVVDKAVATVVSDVAARIHGQHVLLVAGAGLAALCPGAHFKVALEVPSAAAEDLAAPFKPRVVSAWVFNAVQ